MWTYDIMLGFVSDEKKKIIFDMLMEFAYEVIHEWDGEYGEWYSQIDMNDCIKECMSSILEELGKGID